MKIPKKINPIAKTLREPSYRKRVVPSKKRDKLDKQASKEARDAKTEQDT